MEVLSVFLMALYFGTIAYYCFQLIRLFPGLRKWKEVTISDKHQPEITLLIPFRNEQQNILSLLHSLNNLDYPSSNLTVLFINDHSTDQSVNLLRKQLAGVAYHYQVLSLPDSYFGKKAAIDLGIASVTSEIIATTDADCTHSPNWLTELVKPFAEKSTHLSFGGIWIRNHSNPFTYIQHIENIVVQAVSLCNAVVQSPFMCSGASLAFRKESYKAVNPILSESKHIPSGDDQFLMVAINKQFGPDSIKAIPFKKALVFTRAPATVKQLSQQRKRWLSKWSLVASKTNSRYAISIGMTNALIPLFLILGLLDWLSIESWAMGLVIKVIIDLLFLSLVAFYWKSWKETGWYLIVHPVFWFYTIYMLILRLSPDYNWKNRSYPE